MAGAPPTFGPVLDLSQAGHVINAHRLNLAPGRTCRIGDSVYFTWERDDNGLCYARRLNRTTGLLDDAVQIYDLVGIFSGSDPDTTHDKPLLTRLANGSLLSLWPTKSQAPLNVSTGTIPPRHRFLPRLADAGTWTEERGLVSRDGFVGWLAHASSVQYDARSVWEPVSGRTHLLFEAGTVGPLDGTSFVEGLPCTYWQFLRDGTADGPYILVRARGSYPPAADTPGNVFVKGAILVGSERNSERSLYVVWGVSNTFTHGGAQRQHNYDLYCARSVDGGVTWWNLPRTKSRTRLQGIEWDDGYYRVWEGDAQQGYSFAVAIDPESQYPEFVLARPRAGAPIVLGHVDFQQLPSCDLYHARRIGTEYVLTLIDDTTDWGGGNSVEPQFLIAPDGLRFLAFEAGGVAPGYAYSEDKGVTWSGLSSIPGATSAGPQLRLERDPLHPEWAMATWGNPVTQRLVGCEITFGAGTVDHPATLQVMELGAITHVPARAEGDEFPNDGRVFLSARNESTEEKTIVYAKQRAAIDVDPAVLSRTFVVPPLSGGMDSRGLAPDWFNNRRGNVEITYSPDAIGLQIAAVRVPNAQPI